jgi:hypothetical protein
MNNQSLSEKLAAVAVALLLILTAMGNASLMFIFAVIGLAAFIFIYRKNITRGGTLAATMGIALAISISLVVLMS